MSLSNKELSKIKPKEKYSFVIITTRQSYRDTLSRDLQLRLNNTKDLASIDGDFRVINGNICIQKLSKRYVETSVIYEIPDELIDRISRLTIEQQSYLVMRTKAIVTM